MSVVSGMFCDGVGIHHVLGDEEGWTVQWVRQANGTVWTIHQPILNFSFSQTYDLRTQVQDLEAVRRSRFPQFRSHPSSFQHSSPESVCQGEHDQWRSVSSHACHQWSSCTKTADLQPPTEHLRILLLPNRRDRSNGLFFWKAEPRGQTSKAQTDFFLSSRYQINRNFAFDSGIFLAEAGADILVREPYWSTLSRRIRIKGRLAAAET